jgi:predicted negative regulator of RcsB-dependent stress response
MSEIQYAKLTEVFGRFQAELIENYLESNDIDAELFQEAVGNSIYPTTVDGLAKVQIFVEKEKLAEAKILLERFKEKSEDDETT